MASAAFVAKAPEIKIESGVVCVKAQSGDMEMCWHIPLLEFRRAIARATLALRDHDAGGTVIPFDKPPG